MRLVRTSEGFRTDLVGGLISGHSVGVTIGNFDAFHRGHAVLFETLERELKAFPEPHSKMLLSFWPHPRQVLRNVSRQDINTSPEYYSVLTLKERIRLARVFGFDLFYLLHFRKSLAELTPELFVKQHLVETCNAKLVVVGDDWAFGKGRAGNTDVLQSLGEKYGFRVSVVSEVAGAGARISTGAIKNAIREANFKLALELLGRKYVISGRVRHGEKRGRILGFPTANLEFRGLVLPPDGIYACWARFSGRCLPAAVYIGSRPTFGPGRKVIECHILGEEKFALYGEQLELEFVERTREDRSFGSADDLKAAIKVDISEVRRALGVD